MSCSSFCGWIKEASCTIPHLSPQEWGKKESGNEANYAACTVCVTIFSIGSKFLPISNLNTVTLAAHSCAFCVLVLWLYLAFSWHLLPASFTGYAYLILYLMSAHFCNVYTCYMILMTVSLLLLLLPVWPVCDGTCLAYTTGKLWYKEWGKQYNCIEIKIVIKESVSVPVILYTLLVW